MTIMMKMMLMIIMMMLMTTVITMTMKMMKIMLRVGVFLRQSAACWRREYWRSLEQLASYHNQWSNQWLVHSEYPT